MQFTMKQFGIGLSAVAMFLLLSGCGGSNVHLDNPRNEGATFVIDGEEHHLNPGETQEFSLGGGTHKLQIKGDKAGAIVDTTIDVKEGGVIQSGGEYIVWKQLYGIQDGRKTLLNEDWAMIDSTNFFGDLKIYPATDYYIEQNWTLGLPDAMPDTKTLFVTKDYKIESKIFRRADFVKTYRELAEQAKKSQ